MGDSSEQKIHIIGRSNITPSTILAKAQELSDTMDGLVMCWYEEGSERKRINFLTAGLDTLEVNWFLDDLKHILRSGKLTEDTKT